MFRGFGGKVTLRRSERTEKTPRGAADIALQPKPGEKYGLAQPERRRQSMRCTLLEARPESPSRLQTANEAQSAAPEVLDVEELRPRPSDTTSRTSSRFSLREGFPAGPLGGCTA